MVYFLIFKYLRTYIAYMAVIITLRLLAKLTYLF